MSDSLLLDIQKAADNPAKLQKLIQRLKKRGASGLKKPAPVQTIFPRKSSPKEPVSE